MTSVDELREFAEGVQANDWHRLSDDIDRAISGSWSMGAANTSARIVEAARLVGPTPWGEVPWPLVRGGVYAAVLQAGGLDAEPIDEAEMRRVDELMYKHGLTGERAVERYAETVAAIRTPRESAWIASGDGEDNGPMSSCEDIGTLDLPCGNHG